MKNIEWSTDQIILDSKLLDMKPVSLYLLTTGRNAWHNTWSKKYVRGLSVYSSLMAAKKAAEELRVSGTVFVIKQIPGIAMFTTSGVIAFVEFHTEPSFSNLKLIKIQDRIKIGLPLAVAMQPFVRPSEEFWNRPMPSDDSFISVKSDLSENFEAYSDKDLSKKWQSFTNGVDYYLGWTESDINKPSPIWNIYEKFLEINCEENFEEINKQLLVAREKAIEAREEKEQVEAKSAAAIASLMKLFESSRDSD